VMGVVRNLLLGIFRIALVVAHTPYWEYRNTHHYLIQHRSIQAQVCGRL
jgi:hypothetical protein